MEEWKEYRVSEIFNIQNGYAFKSGEFVENSDDTYEVLKIGHIEIGGGLRTDPKKTYVKRNSKYKKWVLEKNDIVMGMTDMKSNVVILGIPALVDKNDTYVLNQRVARLSLKDPHSFDIYFCYYQMLWNEFTTELRKTANSGVQVNLTTSGISTTILYVPNYELQRKIGRLLSSHDDKIENNRKINANLEQQAQALFKSWFVDFEPFKNGEFVESELGMIPKGWRVVSLDEMTSKFGTGLNPRKNFKLGEGNNYYVTIKNMGNNRVYLDDKCDKVTDEAIEKINKRSKLQEGDLLFSGIGTIGRVALVTQTPTNWNTSESVFNMHPAQNISSEFLYILLLSDVFQRYVKIHAQGGVQQGIRMASLKEYRMAIPEDFVLRKFDSIVTPIISRIKNNDNQIDSLAELRDTLLPKLMSGELKVNDIH